MAQTLKDWEKNRGEIPQDPRKRRQMALDYPFPLKEGREPTQCLTRMVGPRNKDSGRPTIKFMSQVTVDLDTPPVWRLRVEFDERDLDIPVTSWTDELMEIAVDELGMLFPEWQTREKIYRRAGSTYVEWKSPLTRDEMLLLGVPSFGGPRAG